MYNLAQLNNSDIAMDDAYTFNLLSFDCTQFHRIISLQPLKSGPSQTALHNALLFS